MKRNLEEWEWDMVLAGDASAELHEAAVKHPDYETRLARFREERATLFQMLYRVECPDPLMLGELHLGLLEPAQQVCVRNHLAHCPYCQEELNTMRETLRQPLYDKGHGQRGTTRRILMRFKKVLGEGGEMAPCAPALRGSPWTAYYEGNGYHLSLVRQSDPRGITLMGSIMVAKASGSARLKQEDRVIHKVPLTGDGAFLFPAVPQGRYDIVITMPDVDLIVEGVELE